MCLVFRFPVIKIVMEIYSVINMVRYVGFEKKLKKELIILTSSDIIAGNGRERFMIELKFMY